MTGKHAEKSRRKRPSKRAARSRRVNQVPSHVPLSGSAHVTRADGNVFADLGFQPEEAINLSIRAQLMMELRDVIAGMTQNQAATLLGVSQPRISHLTRGKIGLFTIDTLVNMLARAGVRTSVSVRRRRPTAA